MLSLPGTMVRIFCLPSLVSGAVMGVCIAAVLWMCRPGSADERF